jgi:hypothetical protein
MRKIYRILAIVLGFAVSALSGWCLISGQGGLAGLIARLFYPGLLASLLLLRTMNLQSLIMAFLLNAILYLLAFFFLLRWRVGRIQQRAGR